MRKQPDNKSLEKAASDNQKQQKSDQQKADTKPGDPTPANPTPTNPTYRPASLDVNATKGVLKGNKHNAP